MAETKMQLVDWLDDICVRFIINLPQEELGSVERICFQIEEAQWFYEDFVRLIDPSLPSMHVREFCSLIFQHCPLLAPFAASSALAYAEWMSYKTRVPVRGAILLNEDMTEVVLVKGWKKNAKWSFPRGKINKEELDLDCAVREAYEEIGYDLNAAGLVPEDKNVKYLEVSMHQQHMRLYVFRGVPMDTYFEPRTRKEISKIQWYKVSDLASSGQHRHMQQHGQVPNDVLKSSQFYMVAPFMKPLRIWIKQQRKVDQQEANQKGRGKAALTDTDVEETLNVPAYDDGPMTTDAEDDTHFQRLLFGLNQGSQNTVSETTNLPEVTSQASPADLSAQLKQMLSIGGQVQPAPTRHVEPNPLLSLLRGGPHGQSFPPPQTPMEQIIDTPPEARTPHHHQHVRPPPYSEMPPPMFPFSPAQGRHEMPSHLQAPPHWQQHPNQHMNQHQNQNASQHMSHRPGFYPGPSNMMHHQQHPHPPVTHHPQLPSSHFPQPPSGQHFQPPSSQQSQYRAGSQPRTETFGSQIPFPPVPRSPQNMRGGDGQVQQKNFSQYMQAPTGPSASQLPTPRFQPSAHAMNLLNVLKSPNVPSSKPAALMSQTQPPQLPELDNSKPLLPSQLLGGSMMQQRMTPSPPPIHQPKPRSSQQDALLNLFKSSTTPAATQALAPLPAAEPIELSAQSSPHVTRDTTRPVQHKLSMRRLPNLNTADSSQKASPHLTSATVSGPLNAPDFETVQKNQPHIVAELGNGVISPSPNTIMQGQFHPQIMARTHSGNQRHNTATPPVPVHTVPHQMKMQAPQPFHPTSILRRSAQEISDMAQQQPKTVVTHPPQPPPHNQPLLTKQPQLPSFDRRDNSGQEQKKALLDLFGGGGAPAPPRSTELPGSMPVDAFSGNLGSSIISPVSPLPSHAAMTKRQGTNDSHRHNSGGETPRSSRISSIASIPGDANFVPTTGYTSAPTSNPMNDFSKATPPIDGSRQQHNHTRGAQPLGPRDVPPPVKRGSMVSDAGGGPGGGQSPITPVEKSFLLGYLQGVVKEGTGKGKHGLSGNNSRQNSLR